MKVSNSSARITTAQRPGAAGVAAAQPGQQKGGVTTPASDQIRLSNLSAYMAASGSDSPQHIQKLASLKDTVSSGDYHVDAFAVSAGIIQDSIQFRGANLL